MHSNTVTEVSYDDYRCSNGHNNCTGMDAIDEESDKYYRCRECYKDMRQSAMKDGEFVPFYVVVSNISRNYGGPEEGGWYYDWTTILKVHKVWDWKSALKMMRASLAEYPQPRYNRHSVLGREGDYVIDMYYAVDQFPRESTERPRYE